MNVVEKIGQIDLRHVKEELEIFDPMRGGTPLQLHKTDLKADASLPIRELDYPEIEYTYPAYQNAMPYTYSVLDEYNMFRTRIMILKTAACYSYHYDHYPRIHIPITTNDKCFIVVEDRLYHLPADGGVYLINTTRYHTALNGTRDAEFSRIHLVGNVDV